MVEAIEAGFPQREIMDAAYAYQRAVDAKEKIVVGRQRVRRGERGSRSKSSTIDEAVEEAAEGGARRAPPHPRREGRRLRPRRPRQACRQRENVMPPLIDAVKTYATVGEISDVMREVFATYEEPAVSCWLSCERLPVSVAGRTLRNPVAIIRRTMTEADSVRKCRDRSRQPLPSRRSAQGRAIRRRRGRRGPGERGRPRPRRREGDAGGDQLHGPGGARADLPRPDRGTVRRARASAHGRGEHVQLRDGVHGLDRGAGDGRRRASRPPTGRRRSSTAIDPATRPSDLLRPGHMFPLRAQAGGVLKRAGQTEASVDLARIAGLDARRGPLRDHERGRHDGAGAGPRSSSARGTASSWSRSPT